MPKPKKRTRTRPRSLFLVARRDEIGYDEARGFVVAALDAAEALATIRAAGTGLREHDGPGDEGVDFWTGSNPDVNVARIGTSVGSGGPKILLRDFNAG